MAGVTGISAVLSADGRLSEAQPRNMRAYGYKMESVYVYQK